MSLPIVSPYNSLQRKSQVSVLISKKMKTVRSVRPFVFHKSGSYSSKSTPVTHESIHRINKEFVIFFQVISVESASALYLSEGSLRQFMRIYFCQNKKCLDARTSQTQLSDAITNIARKIHYQAYNFCYTYPFCFSRQSIKRSIYSA